jgi:hypothetical protein
VKSFILLTVVLFGIILAQEKYYFEAYRQSNTTAEVSETFICKGRLGKILRKNGMVEISPGSHLSAIQDDCAKNHDMGYGDFQNRFRIRASIDTAELTKITVTIAVGSIGEQTFYHKTYVSDPDRPSYDVEFIAPFGNDIYVKYAVLPGTQARLINADIKARFTENTLNIIENGKPLNSHYRSINILTNFPLPEEGNVLMMGKTPEVTQYLPGGIPLD